MDPFSIVVGAVALTEVANKLAGILTDRYKAFNSAPKQMIEIAGQITLCAGLVDVFAKSVDGAGKAFPWKFEQDAASLVKQCRAILREIDEMIPPGSKKPDYQQRLKYAFRDEKKIVKYQDRLKRVQQMFMFMTTCWMYQLPSPQNGQQRPKQPVGLGSAGGSPGISQHAMSEPPMQFNLKGLGGINGNENYEATLTLTPIQRSEEVSRPLREENHFRSDKHSTSTLSGTQTNSLENMRRSPYFSLDLLEPPEKEAPYRRESAQRASFARGEDMRLEIIKLEEERIIEMITEAEMLQYERRRMQRGSAEKKEEDEERDEKRRMEIVRAEAEALKKDKDETRKLERLKTEAEMKKKEKNGERRDFEPVSKKQAEKDIGELISRWFLEDYLDDETYRTMSSSHPPSSPHISSYTETLVGSTYPSNSVPDHSPTNPTKSPSSIPVTPALLVRVAKDWDWGCDGCDKKFFFHDLRFKCQDCLNFDFCPQCFPNAWHKHPTSSFVMRSV